MDCFGTFLVCPKPNFVILQQKDVVAQVIYSLSNGTIVKHAATCNSVGQFFIVTPVMICIKKFIHEKKSNYLKMCAYLLPASSSSKDKLTIR